MDPNNGREAIEDYHTIRQELKSYATDLSDKRELIVASQMDIPGADKKLAQFRKDLEKKAMMNPFMQFQVLLMLV